MPTCFICQKFFPDYKVLALHIQTTKGHNKSKKFAAKVLCSVKDKLEIKPVACDPDYEPTEYGDDNRANVRLQLSGETIGVNCFCPHCKRLSHQNLPVEFLSLEHLWVLNGKPAVLCESCRR